MSGFLRKYGVVATIGGIPLITKDAMDLKADPTLESGDVTVSLDDGDFANIEGAGTFGDFIDVLPAEETSVRIRLSQTQMQSARLTIRFIDQTSPKEWEDQIVLVETYGNALAQHPFDLAASYVPPDNTNIVNIHNIVKENGTGDCAAIKANTDRVDGLIEDVSGDRFTDKALEESPSGPDSGGPRLE